MSSLQSTLTDAGNLKVALVEQTDPIDVNVTNVDTPVELTGDIAVDTWGALDDAKVINPDAASATMPALARGQLKQLVDILAKLGGTGSLKDNGPAWTTVWGVAGLPVVSDDAGDGVSVTDAPTTDQKIVIDDLIVSVDTAMAVQFNCEDAEVYLAGPFYLPANGTIQITPRGKGWKLATANKKLQVSADAAGNIMVHAGYHSEA